MDIREITNNKSFDLYLFIYNDFELEIEKAKSFLDAVKKDGKKLDLLKEKFSDFFDEIKDNYFALFKKKYLPNKYTVKHLIENVKTKDLRCRARYELHILIYMLDVYFYEKIKNFTTENIHLYDIHLLGTYLMEYETFLYCEIERVFKDENLKFNFNNRGCKRTSIINFENFSTLFNLPRFSFIFLGKAYKVQEIENFMKNIGLSFTMPLIQVYLLRKFIEVAVIRDTLNIEKLVNNKGEEEFLPFNRVYEVLKRVIRAKINVSEEKKKQELKDKMQVLEILKSVYEWCNIYIHGWVFPKIWVLDYIIFKLVEELKPNPVDKVLYLNASIIKECHKEIEKEYKKYCDFKVVPYYNHRL